MEEVHGSLSYADHQVPAIPLRVSRLAANVESSPTSPKVRFSATSAGKFLKPSLGNPYGRYPELSKTFALSANVRRNFHRSRHLLSLLSIASY